MSSIPVHVVHLIIVFLSLSGLWYFLDGFFLTRRELGVIANAKPEFESLKKYDRLFVFVIDALRSDFVIHKEYASCSHEPMNCFAYMQKLLLENSSQCSLYKLRSEPPTVTAQRLKALTTGTLPTFIDFRLNLDSSVITEDNIIDQLIHSDRKASMNHSFLIYGDDTWKALFPSQFSEYHVFDSFNTKDLDTVDIGIYSHLWEDRKDWRISADIVHDDGGCKSSVIRSSDWKLLITHFLGVDHIGHTYHAYHPKMSNRLKWMDEILEQIVSCLPDDALLVVLGDHGMTMEGEHGGASIDEIDSGLFVYSHRQLFANNVLSDINSNEAYPLLSPYDQKNANQAMVNPKTVYQVDLVPTLSLLLGIPIPFSSIGKVIPEMFLSQETGDELLLALLANAMQVWQYIVTYTGINNEVWRKDIDTSILSSLQLTEIADMVDHSSSQISRTKMPGLATGAALLSNALRHHHLFIQSTTLNSTANISRDFVANEYFRYFSFFQEFARSKWTTFCIPHMVAGICLLGMCVLGMVLCVLKEGKGLFEVCSKWVDSRVIALVPVLVFLFLFEGIIAFSNSFIIQDMWISLYAIQSTMIILVVICLLGNHLCAVVVLGISMILYRILWDCQRSVYNATTSTLISTTSTTFLWYALSLLSYVILCYILKLSPFFNCSNTSDPSSVNKTNFLLGLVRTSTYASQLLFLLQWYLRYSEAIMLHPLLQILPWFSFALSGVNIAFLFLDLTLNYLLKRRSHVDQLAFLLTNLVSCLSIYVFPYDLLIIFVSLSCVLCSVWVGFTTSVGKDLGYAVCSSLAIAIHLRQWGKFVFYVTGHKLDISALQLSVGFIGCDIFNYWYAGTALAANTFGALFLEVFLLSSVCYWFQFHNSIVQIHTNHTKFHLMMILSYWGYRAYTMWCSAIAVFVLRDHLMLWAIFAPKLLFDSLFWIISVIAFMFVYPCLNCFSLGQNQNR